MATFPSISALSLRITARENEMCRCRPLLGEIVIIRKSEVCRRRNDRRLCQIIMHSLTTTDSYDDNLDCTLIHIDKLSSKVSPEGLAAPTVRSIRSGHVTRQTLLKILFLVLEPFDIHTRHFASVSYVTSRRSRKRREVGVAWGTGPEEQEARDKWMEEWIELNWIELNVKVWSRRLCYYETNCETLRLGANERDSLIQANSSVEL